MKTVIKIIITVVIIIILGAIVGIMQERHMFGKAFVSLFCLFILKLIWSSDKNDSTNKQVDNLENNINTPLKQGNIPTENNSLNKTPNGIYNYNGGHNTTETNNMQPDEILNNQPTPEKNFQKATSLTNSKEFNNTNPYTKN